jgi:LacI family transcriptional regulator
VLFDVKHPYDRKIIDGILEALQNSNNNLQMTFMTYDEALLVARDNEWDAIIADFDRSRNIDLCLSMNAPVVAVVSNTQNLPEADFPGVVYLAPDNGKICELARDHFMACGIKHFGYFAGMAHEIGFWSDERKKSFKKHVLDAGLDWIGDFNTYNIRDHLEKGSDKHTGYLCASDTQARQLITLANNLKIDVPGQISVMGIDNDEIENQLSLVPISSVTLDLHSLGKEAFEALHELTTSEPTSIRHVQPGEVVNRLSAYLEVSDDALVSKALKYIYRHYHRPIKAEQVIAECETSRNTLENRFKKVLDKTIHQVLHDVRLENAKDMLLNSQKSIDDIAIQCGLSSPQYLYYLFRKEVGMTPTKYREIKLSPLDHSTD